MKTAESSKRVVVWQPGRLTTVRPLNFSRTKTQFQNRVRSGLDTQTTACKGNCITSRLSDKGPGKRHGLITKQHPFHLQNVIKVVYVLSKQVYINLKRSMHRKNAICWFKNQKRARRFYLLFQKFPGMQKLVKLWSL